MMINKRLIDTVEESKKYIAGNVIAQWVSLLSNVVLMFGIAELLNKIYIGNLTGQYLFYFALVAIAALLIRSLCTMLSTKFGYLSSKTVKEKLRTQIFQKLLKLGPSYRENVKSSEAVQMASEGVDQLETYFAGYLPQFFFAMIAPITLFVIIATIDIWSAVVLLICVPMIPIAIAAVQTWAKKLFFKYWGNYTSLGDTFLENLQGLTTLKIYEADDYKNEVMNKEAKEFRKITMRVLTMQLNSITIMDLVAYGGAALGIIMATVAFSKGKIDLAGAITIILLSADFFIPMRRLGSFFHIAMNGMAAADNIFNLLDIEVEDDAKKKTLDTVGDIEMHDVHFSYNEEREILHGVNLKFPVGSFTAIVGKSGCGKSTVSGILTGKNKHYTGSVSVGDLELSEIKDESLLQKIVYISNHSYLFKGTVRENLLMGKPNATEEEMWAVLERVNLADFLKAENGLDTVLLERASNLSGGQCQRLALARALLFDAPVYIFDEAASNVDVESEEQIMQEIEAISKTKTVLLISHRLANVVHADNVYVLKDGDVVEEGTHEALLQKNGVYKTLWTAQQTLENYGKVGELK